MKSRSLFVRSLVALSSASSLFAPIIGFVKPALAQSAGTLSGTASSGQVNILTPSTQTFLLNTNSSSPSTIQYNGSQGQNNNFAVGTGTNFGVSASSSSTPDYAVSSKADLGSATGTTFTNQIGTSGAASASDSFAQSASAAASRQVDYLATQNWNSAVKVDGKAQFGGSGEYLTQAGWEAKWKQSSTGTQALSEAFKSSFTSIQQGNSNSTDMNGTISGTFTSTQGGSGTAAQSSGSSTKVYVQDNTADITTRREATAADFNRARNGASMSFYANTTETTASASTAQVAAAAATAMSAAATSSSSNSVTVKGVGANASFAASTATQFTTDIKSLLGVVQPSSGTLVIAQGSDGKISSSGTANGSANGNFGTNSTASSNSATYSSVFYQAF